MIKLLFFAGIRESLGCGELLVEPQEQVQDIASLLDMIESNQLVTQIDVLRAENVVTAINQVKVTAQHEVKDGDEVAFYPPVTGG